MRPIHQFAAFFFAARPNHRPTFQIQRQWTRRILMRCGGVVGNCHRPVFFVGGIIPQMKVQLPAQGLGGTLFGKLNSLGLFAVGDQSAGGFPSQLDIRLIHLVGEFNAVNHRL